MEDHLFELGLNVKQLRLACGIHDPSVTTEFRRELVLSLKVYLDDRRMEPAAFLLRR